MGDEDDWNKLFDKSKATKVPENFPGNVNDIALELEDVLEDVTDEIDNKGTSKFENQFHRQTTPDTRTCNLRNKTQGSYIKNLKQNGVQDEIEEEEKKQSKFFKTPMNGNDLLTYPKYNGLLETEREKFNCQRRGEKEEGVSGAVDEDTSKTEDRNEDKKLSHTSTPVFNQNKEAKDEDNSDEIISRGNEIDINNGTAAEENVLEAVDRNWNGKPINHEIAKGLKLVLFGGASSSFDNQWKKQTISLNKPDHYAMRYHKGPSEGVMACIQSFVLRHVLFNEMSDGSDSRVNSIKSYHKRCIVSALTDILWHAGQSKTAVVCLPAEKEVFSSEVDFKEDGLLEKLEIFEFNQKDDLDEFFSYNIDKFEDPEKSGCILFIYSVILTRTIDKVMEDLAAPNECLIGPDGTTNQSLINLLLTGQATPHVFNISKEITENDGKITVQYGISKRNHIGFLSYQEAENPKKYSVGSMLKTPIFPIWVINCNNHICVLFCKKRNLLSDWKLERRFDLYYFGGVSRHFSFREEDIRLTIDTIQSFDPIDSEDEFSSCLEETIRTKWQDCVINWNGYHRF